MDLADPAVADDLGGLAEGAFAALLRADLEDGAVLALEVAEDAALAHGEGQRLLAEDVLAVAHGHGGDGRMPVVGGDDHHRVDVGAGDQLFEVIDREAALVVATVLFGVGLLDPALRVLALFLDDVADADDLHVIAAQRVPEVSAHLQAHADADEVDPVARRVLAEDRGRDDGRQRDGRADGGLEEAATREMLALHGSTHPFRALAHGVEKQNRRKRVLFIRRRCNCSSAVIWSGDRSTPSDGLALRTVASFPEAYGEGLSRPSMR